MAGSEKKRHHEHLGDGLYVAFDGYQIEIRVNDHRSLPVAYLEPRVMDAMVSYINKIKSLKKGES